MHYNSYTQMPWKLVIVKNPFTVFQQRDFLCNMSVNEIINLYEVTISEGLIIISSD